MKSFGLDIAANEYREDRDFVGEVASTASGNIVLRVLRIKSGEQHALSHAYVVLTLDEARALMRELHAVTEHAILEPGRECPCGAVGPCANPRCHLLTGFRPGEVAAMRER